MSLHRDWDIAAANVRRHRRRLVSLSVVVTLGTVVALACVGVVARAADSTSARITDGTALRTVDVGGGAARPGSTPLTTDHVQSFRGLPHVQSVEPSLQASFSVKTDTVQGLFYGTVPQPDRLPPVVASVRDRVFPLAPGETVLPARSAGGDPTATLGHDLAVEYTRQVAPGAGEAVADSLHVVALYDPAYTADGPTAAYAVEGDVVRWAAARAGTDPRAYLAAVGHQSAAVVVDSAAALPVVQARLAAQGYQAVSVQQRLSQLPQQVELLRWLGLLVVGLLLVYSAAAGTALAGTFVRQRTREIGILKALGFRRRRVLRLFTLELLIVGAVPALAGVVLGVAGSVAVSAVTAGRSVAGVVLPGGVAAPPLAWAAALLVLPAAAVVLGGLLPARRAAALAPDTALREW